MPLLKLENASLAFGHVALLDHAEFQLDPGERVALIGRNGTGKSSLLRLLGGLAHPDDGRVWREPGLKLSFVPQEPEFEPGDDCFAAVAGGLGEASRLLNAYHALLGEVATQGDERLLTRLQDLQHELEQADAWRLNTRVEQTLSRIGLDGAARALRFASFVAVASSSASQRFNLRWPSIMIACAKDEISTRSPKAGELM